ncbi:MAG: hypothetical protein ACRDTC_23200 [Pseudonocardiaceae bacterium]
MDSPPSYPDGLSPAVIDALITEVDAMVRPVRRVPPLFADRDAVLRRERRHTHRALARVVRSVPLAVPTVADRGEAA